MRFLADLHIHSYLSRATSKDLNLEQLCRSAQRKGISIVGTGDFTHPRWFAELRDKLVPAEPGLFALRDDLATAVSADLPNACRSTVRFMLSVEVSSIYKRDDKVRKVHNLVYVPDFESAARVATRLARIGNIESDGRPILGLDSRDLLEIVLECSPDGYLVPAHIWTPWFSALGAQSGFDAIDECFGDLASHIFAVETGLSSDPAMNWRVSALDRFALVSSSDAHSPEKLGREATLFDCDLSYFALRDALRERREGFVGTLEFFPEEGKYHLDGHRKCGVVLAPEQARALSGICPTCGKKLTAGVMGRVEQLADRPTGFRPDGAKPFSSLVPLAEVLGEVLGVGGDSTRVRKMYDRLLSRVGPELAVLREVPLADIDREGPPLLGEAIERIRNGRVHLRAGHDGEYGVVRAFSDDERRKLLSQTTFAFGLVDFGTTLPESIASDRPISLARTVSACALPSPSLSGPPSRSRSAEGWLNPEQAAAVAHGLGPLLIVAGPGTGKTWTVVQRIARLARSGTASPRAITAITFTRRAAGELSVRLTKLLGGEAASIAATTFHAFGLDLLRAFPAALGKSPQFVVADEAMRARCLEAAKAEAAPRDARTAAKLGEAIGKAKACLLRHHEVEAELSPIYAAYERALDSAGAVDFDDLVLDAVRLLETSEEARAFVEERCRWLFVDEYQDVNAAQYCLVRLLAAPDANLCAVGDPDQAIYGFRGADPSYFLRFQQDYPSAAVVVLQRNYRSPASVVRAATAVIEKSPGRAGRPLEPEQAATTPVVRLVAADAREEADLIAEQIQRALGGTSLEGSHTKSDDVPPLSLDDVAVLVRTSSQMDPIAEALVRANLPFFRVCDDPLTGRPGVAELLADLRKLVNQAEDLGELAPYRGHVGCRPVSELIAQIAAARGADPARRTAVDFCATLAVPFGRDVDAFLSTVPLLQESDAHETQKVAVLTLHAAKGLEFPLVFVAGCEDGLLPLRLGGDRSIDFEEERRLLYVGMTRAKSRLVLTSAKRRSLLGRSTDNGPSPFLEGLPPGLFLHVPVPKRRARQMSLWR